MIMKLLKIIVCRRRNIEKWKRKLKWVDWGALTDDEVISAYWKRRKFDFVDFVRKFFKRLKNAIAVNKSDF